MTDQPNSDRTPEHELLDKTLMENYPHKYIRDVAIGGRPFRFRPVRPDDEDMMVRMFITFSKETIFHRFFTAVTMQPSKAKRFTHIDYKRQMAIVCEEDTGGERHLVGVARYNASPDSDTEAEMAIVIGDPWQGKGVGTALLNYLLEIAELEGFRSLYGLVHYDNLAVPRMFSKMNRPHRTKNTGAELRFEVTLSSDSSIRG